MASLTMLDIAIRNGSDRLVGLIEEVLDVAPEVTGVHPTTGATIPNVGDARTIRGRQYRTLVRTALPPVAFRDANTGNTPSRSTYVNRLVETFVLDPRIEVDKAVADSDEEGPEAVMADEAMGVMKSSLIALSKQFYYGRDSGNADAKGHPGLIDSYDRDNMEVDATGTTDGGATSIWLVKFGRQNVRWVFGNEGQMTLSDVDIQRIVDPNDATKAYSAYCQELTTYPGVQFGAIHSAVRIKNITEEADKGATDDLVAQALAKFPIGVRPDAIFLTRRSLEQIRSGRTPYHPTGQPVPTPTDYESIPYVPTDGILDTEALAL